MEGCFGGGGGFIIDLGRSDLELIGVNQPGMFGWDH